MLSLWTAETEPDHKSSTGASVTDPVRLVSKKLLVTSLAALLPGWTTQERYGEVKLDNDYMFQFYVIISISDKICIILMNQILFWS